MKDPTLGHNVGPEQADSAQCWGVFICYRQDDGREAAEWLHEKLHGQRVPLILEGYAEAPVLDVYFDQTADAVEDWTRVHEPALKRAKAFLLVCSPGAHSRLGPEDWVHRELDWWLENRAAPPIVIDTLGTGRYVPDAVQERWPRTQRILVTPEEWERLAKEERSHTEKNTVDRLIGGIREREQQTTYEDFRREQERTRQLRKQAKTLRRQASTLAQQGDTLRRQRKRLSWFLGIAVLAALTAAGLGFLVKEKRKDAVRLRWIAAAQTTAARALREVESHQDLELASLLAKESFDSLLEWEGEDYLTLSDQALRSVLAYPNPNTVLRGHSDEVTGVAVNHDGSLVASGSADGDVRIWRFGEAGVETTLMPWHSPEDTEVPKATGEGVTPRPAETDGSGTGPRRILVEAVALTADSRYLAASNKEQVLVWRLEDPTAKPMQVLVPGGPALGFSPDGQRLAVGDCEGGIYVGEVASALVGSLKTHRLSAPPDIVEISAVAFSADGASLAAAGLGEREGPRKYRRRRGIWVWEPPEPGISPAKVEERYGAESLAFTPDGTGLAIASGSPRLLPIAEGALGGRARAPSPIRVETVIAVGPEKRLASGSYWGDIRVWHLPNLDEPREVLRGHSRSVDSLAISGDGSTLVSGSSDGTVRVWDLSQQASEPRTAKARSKNVFVREVTFTPDGSAIVFVDEKSDLNVWRPDSLSREPELIPLLRSARIAFSPIDDVLAISTKGKIELRRFPLDSKAVSPTLEPVYLGDLIPSVVIGPNGERLASVSFGKAKIWDLRERRLLAEFEWPANPGFLQGVAFSPRDDILAVGDKGIALWRFGDNSAQVALESTSHDPWAEIAFSRDGTTLASGGPDGSVWLWNPEDLNMPLHKLTGHRGSVYSLDFSPTRDLLASGGVDSLVRLWDTSKPETEPQILRGLKLTVRDVVFSPDGEKVAAVDEEGNLRLWTVSTAALAEQICNRVRRNLSLEEWQDWQRSIGAELPYERTCPNLPAGIGVAEDAG